MAAPPEKVLGPIIRCSVLLILSLNWKTVEAVQQLEKQGLLIEYHPVLIQGLQTSCGTQPLTHDAVLMVFTLQQW